MKLRSAKRGFTLIELLVVIAIIGILSSVVLASLGTARVKARDATRISDMKNVQLALELYYDSTQSYPPNTTGTANAYTFAGPQLVAALVPTYIPKLPVDPTQTGAVAYHYVALLSPTTLTDCSSGAVGACQSYGLGASLERGDNPVLDSDTDSVTGYAGFYPLGTTGCGGATAGTDAANTDLCYSTAP